MSHESMYELRRKFEVTGGDASIISQALQELESLSMAEKSASRLNEFLLCDDVVAILDVIACKPDILTIALLRWLTNDEVSELAFALCHSVDVHYLDAKVAVAFKLTGSDARLAEAVALRLVSNGAAPAVSIGWLLSLAAEHGKGESTAALVNEIIEYHVNELPLSTEQLLSNNKNSLVSMEVPRSALDSLRRFNEYLNELPKVREISMPVHMHLMYTSAHRKRNRTINSESQKRSFFGNLFKTQQFKYSTRTAVEVHHGDRTDEQTLTMAQVSVSLELPVSEMADPIRGYFQRQNFWKRGKI